MRAAKPQPQVTKGQTIEAHSEVLTPTIRLSMAQGSAEAVTIIGPEGVRNILLVGVTERDRKLLWLDDGLRECARAVVPEKEAMRQVLERVLRGREPADEMLATAGDYVESLRRGPRPGRPPAGAQRRPTRAELFYRLVVLLIPEAAALDQLNLQRALREARRRAATARKNAGE